MTLKNGDYKSVTDEIDLVFSNYSMSEKLMLLMGLLTVASCSQPQIIDYMISYCALSSTGWTINLAIPVDYSQGIKKSLLEFNSLLLDMGLFSHNDTKVSPIYDELDTIHKEDEQHVEQQHIEQPQRPKPKKRFRI